MDYTELVPKINDILAFLGFMVCVMVFSQLTFGKPYLYTTAIHEIKYWAIGGLIGYYGKILYQIYFNDKSSYNN